MFILNAVALSVVDSAPTLAAKQLAAGNAALHEPTATARGG